MKTPFRLAALRCALALVLLVAVADSKAQLALVNDHTSAEPENFSSSALPAEPTPAWAAADPADPAPGGHERPFTMPGVEEHYGLLSRMSVGSSVSFSGIGALGTFVLNEHADARVDTSWFSYNTGHFEVSGVNVVGDFHFASMGTKLDWYPTRSMWRISPGMLFYNGNRAYATLDLNGGTSINVNGRTYWSATANPATGATPLTGRVDIGLHSHTPAFTISGGFGKYVPRSHRHWSFPTEFGVAFTGAPTLNVALTGWVCKDYKQTQCSDIADPHNPVGLAFQDNLNAAMNKWRHDLDAVRLYPILSTAFMYSFDLPGSR